MKYILAAVVAVGLIGGASIASSDSDQSSALPQYSTPAATGPIESARNEENGRQRESGKYGTADNPPCGGKKPCCVTLGLC